MARVLTLMVVLFFVVGYSCSSPGENKNRVSVKLTLFYESYCPYSISFIVDQLIPTWRDLGQYIHLDFVPYGNAQQSYDHGHFNFTCQHGPKECVANTLHACAVDQACHGKGTLHCHQNQLAKALYYVKCLMEQHDQQAASHQCAKVNGLHPSTITECANGTRGEWLESSYGNETKAFHNPPVTYVPFIVINNKHTEAEQKKAETDLRTVICSYIPDQC